MCIQTEVTERKVIEDPDIQNAATAASQRRGPKPPADGSLTAALGIDDVPVLVDLTT